MEIVRLDWEGVVIGETEALVAGLFRHVYSYSSESFFLVSITIRIVNVQGFTSSNTEAHGFARQPRHPTS